MGFSGYSAGLGGFGRTASTGAGALSGVQFLPPGFGTASAELARIAGVVVASGRFDEDLPITPDPPPSGGEERVLIGGTEFPVTAGSTVYVGSTASVNEGKVRVGLPALSVVELHVNSSAAPGAGESITVTVRKDGTNTTLAATISGTQVSSSATGSVGFASGADFSVSVSTSSGAAEATVGFSIKTQFGS